MNEIDILGGDFPLGVWEGGTVIKHRNGATIDLYDHLKSVEQLIEHNQVSLKRIAVSAAIGALLAGPLAALGAGLLFGKRKSISFVAELVDGRQFLGRIDNDRYPKLVALAMGNRNK